MYWTVVMYVPLSRQLIAGYVAGRFFKRSIRTVVAVLRFWKQMSLLLGIDGKGGPIAESRWSSGPGNEARCQAIELASSRRDPARAGGGMTPPEPWGQPNRDLPHPPPAPG